MEKNINQILNDLYIIDKDLKKHEKELVKIIKELIKSQPDTKFNEKFAQELRVKILERARELKKSTHDERINIWSNFFSLNKMSYAFGGVVIALLLVIPIMSYINKPDIPFVKKGVDLNLETKIAKVKNRAFGDLSAPSIIDAGESFSLSKDNAAPQAMEESALELGIGSGGGAGVSTDSARIIAPEFINYNYKYIGDELNISDEEMAVYKKVKNDDLSKVLVNNVLNLNLDQINLYKFKNLSITNLSMVEDREFGYYVNFNLLENIIYVSTNWEKWPRIEMYCKDLRGPENESCYAKYRLKIKDVPADEEIIAVATKFLKDYNINMDYYGEGEVQDYWRKNYELARDKSLAYIPDIISVVYPLILDGEELHDESGNKSGINVQVNIRHNIVAGVNGLGVNNYQSSNYKTETDAEKLINIAEEGGLRRMYNYESPTKIVEIELGTPEIHLMRYWKFNPEMGKGGEELYIPALIFPIEKIPEGVYFYQKSIIVPLVKEVLENRQNPPIGIPEPMPLLRAEESIESAEIMRVEEDE